MAISVDWGNKIIFVPRADLPVIQVTPEVRELDADWFRLQLKLLEESEEGMPFLDTHKHTTEVVISGVTYARFVEIINGYTLELEAGVYGVSVSGANVNFLDVKVPNSTSMLLNNSSGLVRVVDENDIWNYQPADSTAFQILDRNRHFEACVWIDTDAAAAGDGSQASPFNDLGDAIDFAEANLITTLVVYSDIIIDRNLKNFQIRGVGVPEVDTNGQDLKNSEFKHVRLTGSYVDRIIAQECELADGFILNGYYETCALLGDLTCVNNSNVLMTQCISGIPGTERPTISMNAGGTTNLSVRKYGGGMTILDCDSATDTVTVEISEGALTFDSTCTDGNMVARGNCQFSDESAGAVVTDHTMPELTWRHTWALSVAKYLGLK